MGLWGEHINFDQKSTPGAYLFFTEHNAGREQRNPVLWQCGHHGILSSSPLVSTNMSRHYSDYPLPTAIVRRQIMEMYEHPLSLDDDHCSLQGHTLLGTMDNYGMLGELELFDGKQAGDPCLELALDGGSPRSCLAGQANLEAGVSPHVPLLEFGSAAVEAMWANDEASCMPEEHEPGRIAEPADETIQRVLQAQVTPGNCNLIRVIFEKISALMDEGTSVLHVSPDQSLNCVWGFNVLEVRDPVRFNQAFRAIAPKGRGDKEIKRPTEVFMKIMRFCGVTARRGARGPAEADPDRRDFMYSYFYDFDADKQEYMRRKLCLQGYCPEMRRAAGKRKGAFIDETFSKRATRS